VQEVARLLHLASVAHALGLPSPRRLTYDERVQRVVRASSLALLMVSVVARGEPLGVGMLPSRSPDAPALRERLLRLGAAAGATAAPATLTLAPFTRRADGLSAAGRLDEAAALYDLAVEQGTRAPLEVEDQAALVHALVARASIGLARGEQAQAEMLLERALRWDPTLTLLPDENTPRMRAAFGRVGARAGAPPPVTSAELGARCDHLLVARRLGPGTLEVSRVDACQPAARTRLGVDTPDAAALAALGLPPAPRALAPSSASASSSSSSSSSSSAAQRPLYRRAWLWVTVSLVAVAVAGAGVGIWAATRPSDAGTWNVTPHF
jgi:hypothetical protein